MKSVQKIIGLFSVSLIFLSMVFTSCTTSPDVEPDPEPTPPPTPNPPVAYSEFVTVLDTDLYLKGKKWSPYGASLYPTGHESQYHQSNFRTYMEEQISKAASIKMNNVRVVDYINGVTSDPFDEKIWANVDYVIAKAEEKGMKVLLDLSTYRNYLKDQKKIVPYNMSDWKDFITFVGNRYKDNPTVWLYSLAGEADPPNGDDRGHPLRPTSQQLSNFYRQASDLLHSVAPKQLISCGGFIQMSWNSGINWKEIFAMPNIHIPNVHLYGDELSAFPEIANWCKTQKRPIYIEEFGMERTVSTGDSKIAEHYRTIFSLKKTYNAVGIGFWNFGPQTTFPTYDVNESLPQTWELIKQNAP